MPDNANNSGLARTDKHFQEILTRWEEIQIGACLMRIIDADGHVDEKNIRWAELLEEPFITTPR